MKTKRRPLHDPLPPSTIAASFGIFVTAISNLLIDERFHKLSGSGQKKFVLFLEFAVVLRSASLKIIKLRELLAILILCCAKWIQIYSDNPSSLMFGIENVPEIISYLHRLVEVQLITLSKLKLRSTMLRLDDADFGTASAKEAVSLVNEVTSCSNNFVDAVLKDVIAVATQIEYLGSTLRTVLCHLRTKRFHEFWSGFAAITILTVLMIYYILEKLEFLNLRDTCLLKYTPILIVVVIAWNLTPLFVFEDFNFLSLKQRSARESNFTHFYRSWKKISTSNISVNLPTDEAFEEIRNFAVANNTSLN